MDNSKNVIIENIKSAIYSIIEYPDNYFDVILSQITPSMISNFQERLNKKPKEYQSTLKLFGEYGNLLYSKLKKTGICWVITPNVRTDVLHPFAFELFKNLQDIGFIMKNNMIWFTDQYMTVSDKFVNSYCNVGMFVKNKRTYYFNKDPIREKHIWKDAEWGLKNKKRESNYHPIGKDPSNFWLPSTDDGKGKITSYNIMDTKEMVSRCILPTLNKNNKLLLAFIDKKNITDFNNDDRIEELIVIPGDEDKLDITAEPKKTAVDVEYVKIEKDVMDKTIEGTVFLKSSEYMNEVATSEINSIITSPPYWGLKNYRHPDQIGFNESYTSYLVRIKQVFSECHRVLSNDGLMWININSKMRNGNLIFIPHDFIKISMSIGFYLQDIIIWHKPNSIAGLTDRNLVDKIEYILLFSKSQNFKFYPKKNKTDYPGTSIEFNNINVWRIPHYVGSIGFSTKAVVGNRSISHTAMFPYMLPLRCIEFSTKAFNYVLDPFLGSGTTAMVASEYTRNWIGYEINPDYQYLIDKKVGIGKVTVIDSNFINEMVPISTN